MRAETESAILASLGEARSWKGPGPDFSPDGYSAAAFEADLERVFGRAWLAAARRSELPEPGSWRTFALGRWRVLLVHGEDGRVRAFHNVCRHRGALLKTAESGCDRRLVCRFHDWVYATDGRLMGARDAASYGPGLDPSTRGLLPVACEERWGFVWIRLSSDGPTLDAFLGEELRDHLDGWLERDLVVHHARSYDGAFSWRLGNEGSMEGLHLPSAHPHSANAVSRPDRAGTMRLGDHSVAFWPYRLPDLFEPDGVLGREAAAVGVASFEGLSAAQRRISFVYHVFPNTILNLVPHHVGVFHFWPVAPGRCRHEVRVLGRPARDEAQSAFYRSLGKHYAAQNGEDHALWAQVQEGCATGALTGPLPLSSHEGNLAHFQERLRAWHEQGGS